jgi:hypothetical protein
LPHHPARGDHRQTSPSCDEDPPRPFGFWGAESGASRNGPANSRLRMGAHIGAPLHCWPGAAPGG